LLFVWVTLTLSVSKRFYAKPLVYTPKAAGSKQVVFAASGNYATQQEWEKKDLLNCLALAD